MPKIFNINLREIFSRSSNLTLAPRDVLFEAQLPFLRLNFSHYKLKDVFKPTDGSPYVFYAEANPKEEIADMRRRIIDANWGDFTVKSLLFTAHDTGPIDIRVSVVLRQ